MPFSKYFLSTNKNEGMEYNPFHTLIESAPDAFVVHKDGKFLYANKAALCLVGVNSFDELASLSILDFFQREERDESLERMRLATTEKELSAREAKLLRQDGQEIVVELHTISIDFHGSKAIQTIIYDITERKRVEIQRELTSHILQVLNRGVDDQKSLLREVLHLIRECMDFDALGLRIREGNDFPYCEQIGFFDDFLCEEYFLCAKFGNSMLVRDDTSQSRLECMRSLALSEKTIHQLSCFTESGSFWTNDSSEILTIPPDVDPRLNPRNRCIHSGFRSIALIPIRSGQEIIGLLQLNDRRKGRFCPELIRFFEDLGDQIGLAIQRKQTEEALHGSEEQLRLFIQHAPADIAMFDNQMRYLVASRRWIDNHNLSSKKILAEKDFHGRCLYESFPDIPEHWKEIHQRCLAGEVIHSEDPITIDGITRWWRCQTLPWHAVSGQVGGIIIFSEDVTAEKQVRETQEREREILQAVMNGAKNSHLVYLNRDFSYACVNDAYAKTCGYQPWQMIGKNHFDLYPHRENEKIFKRVRDTGEPAAYYDKPFEFPDQPERGITYWDWTLIPVKDANENILGLVLSLYDTTKRKRYEEFLQNAKSELETKVRERTIELSQTVAMLQHEISLRKSTEETLFHRSEQLRELALELTNAEQREKRRLAHTLHEGLQQMLVGAKYRLESIMSKDDFKRNSTEIVKIINEAIETSRSLTAELSPPILCQSGLIAALKWLAERMQTEHGFEIELVASETIHISQPELAGFLFQAIKELLVNIIKHAGVRTARVCINMIENQIGIMVEDKGSGFDQTRLRASGGNAGGFGLFSISERISMLGGSLKIDSKYGKGSKIEIAVPLPSIQIPDPLQPIEILPEASPKAPSETSIQKGNKIRIVIVDDHRMMREGLSSLLKILPDMEIVGEASDGKSAVTIIHELHPDVVLMDISMPVMDGIQSTRIVHSELPDIQIIGLSMFPEDEQAGAMREAGAVDYVTKSGPSENIIAAIRNCFVKRFPKD